MQWVILLFGSSDFAAVFPMRPDHMKGFYCSSNIQAMRLRGFVHLECSRCTACPSDELKKVAVRGKVFDDKIPLERTRKGDTLLISKALFDESMTSVPGSREPMKAMFISLITIGQYPNYRPSPIYGFKSLWNILPLFICTFKGSFIK